MDKFLCDERSEQNNGVLKYDKNRKRGFAGIKGIESQCKRITEYNDSIEFIIKIHFTFRE